jgi:hypothetical protein
MHGELKIIFILKNDEKKSKSQIFCGFFHFLKIKSPKRKTLLTSYGKSCALNIHGYIHTIALFSSTSK